MSARTGNFQVELNTILNTKNIEEQIKQLGLTLKSSTQMEIKLENGDKVIRTINTLKDGMGNLYKQVQEFNEQGILLPDGDKGVQRITENVKTLTTEFSKIGNAKGEVVKMKEEINSMNDTIVTKTTESTKVVAGFLQKTETTQQVLRTAKGEVMQYGEEQKKITNIVAQIDTTTTKHKATIQDAGKSYNALITVTDKVYSNGEHLKVITEQYTNELGQLVEIIKQVDGQGNQVATTVRNVTETTDKFTKISATLNTTLADGTQIIKSRNELGQKLTTTIKEEDNGMGLITKTTKVYNETLQKTVSVKKEVIDKTAEYKRIQNDITTSTTKEEKIITDLGKRYKALVTTKTEVNAEGKITKTVTKEYTDEMGRTVTVVDQLGANNQKLASTQRTVNDTLKQGTTIGQKFTDIVMKVSKFYLATLPIRTFQKAITDAIETVKDFDAAITEMAKVADHSGESLKQYANDLATLGQDVARTKTEMVEAATGWIKAGYSDEDAAQLARFSALLQNTADEELSGAEATSILVSQLKAYHMEADEAIKVTDIINQVSADFAVSSGDISKGLTVASASMATFGNSIEETTALN